MGCGCAPWLVLVLVFWTTTLIEVGVAAAAGFADGASSTSPSLSSLYHSSMQLKNQKRIPMVMLWLERKPGR